MRIHLAIALSLILLAACQTTDPVGNGGPTEPSTPSGPENERTERTDGSTTPSEPFSEVLVETWNGSVNVIAGAGATVEVNATLFATGHTASEASQRAESIQLVAAPDPNTPSRLHIRAEFPGGRPPVTHGGHLAVTLPPTMKVVVKANNSWVHVRNTSNDVEITTNKAECTVTDVGGSLLVKTTEQPVTALRIGGNVEISTTIGRIVLHEFGGKVRLTNRQGPIEIYHDKPTEPVDIQANTFASSITSELPGTIRADLILSAPNGGRVIAERNLKGVKLTDRVSLADQFRCKTNGGGEGKIEYTADNGTVDYKVKEFTQPVGSGG